MPVHLRNKQPCILTLTENRKPANMLLESGRRIELLNTHTHTHTPPCNPIHCLILSYLDCPNSTQFSIWLWQPCGWQASRDCFLKSIYPFEKGYQKSGSSRNKGRGCPVTEKGHFVSSPMGDIPYRPSAQPQTYNKNRQIWCRCGIQVIHLTVSECLFFHVSVHDSVHWRNTDRQWMWPMLSFGCANLKSQYISVTSS